MKVGFLKSIAHPEFYMYSTSSAAVPVTSITSLLKSKFESINFYNDETGTIISISVIQQMKLHFCFGPAIAAFLLWSSNRIEI
jgi:hypothetical protein